MTKTRILAQAKRLRICCEVQSPGDGVSRYNFHTPGPKPHTYGRTLGHCLGKREAEVFLRGYEEGRESRRSDIITRFPEFLSDEPVNGGDMVDFVSDMINSRT